MLDLFDAEAEGDIEDGHLGRVNLETGEILSAVKATEMRLQIAGRMRHEWSAPVGGHG